jgi:hypothetical protein
MRGYFEAKDPDGLEKCFNWIKKHEYPLYITVAHKNKRNTAQNRLLWSLLSDISKQVKMQMFDGQELSASAEDWKDFLSAIFYKEQKIARGENGEAILIGRSTSRMEKKEFSEFIECILAFGSQRDVVFTDTIPEEYQQWANYAG